MIDEAAPALVLGQRRGVGRRSVAGKGGAQLGQRGGHERRDRRVKVDQRVQRVPAEGAVHRLIGEDALQRGGGFGMGAAFAHRREVRHRERLADAEVAHHGAGQIRDQAAPLRHRQVFGREVDRRVRAAQIRQARVGDGSVVQLVAYDARGGVQQRRGEPGLYAPGQHLRGDRGAAVLCGDAPGPFVVDARGHAEVVIAGASGCPRAARRRPSSACRAGLRGIGPAWRALRPRLRSRLRARERRARRPGAGSCRRATP